MIEMNITIVRTTRSANFSLPYYPSFRRLLLKSTSTMTIRTKTKIAIIRMAYVIFDN